MDMVAAVSWRDVGAVDDVPRLGSRVVETPSGDIAVFRAADDTVFALRDSCPHKQGKLSQGIVHGHRVTCPLHNWVIELADGRERPYANAPRTLDVDLILYGQSTVDEQGLVVPHPRFRERAFVLEPLAEIAPDLVDPVTGLTVRALLARLGQHPAVPGQS